MLGSVRIFRVSCAQVWLEPVSLSKTGSPWFHRRGIPTTPEIEQALCKALRSISFDPIRSRVNCPVVYNVGTKQTVKPMTPGTYATKAKWRKAIWRQNWADLPSSRPFLAKTSVSGPVAENHLPQQFHFTIQSFSASFLCNRACPRVSVTCFSVQILAFAESRRRENQRINKERRLLPWSISKEQPCCFWWADRSCECNYDQCWD